MLSINPMNNNYSQSFGMAYRPMKGVNTEALSNKLAEEVHASNAPKIIQQELTDVIEAIKPLKSLVLSDGEKVIVEHPVTGGKFEVLNYEPWHNEGNDYVINYNVGAIDEGYDFPGMELKNISIRYPQKATGIGFPAWNAAWAGSPILRKHIIAKEIAEEFDRQLAVKTAKVADDNAKKAAIKNTSAHFQQII